MQLMQLNNGTILPLIKLINFMKKLMNFVATSVI